MISIFSHLPLSCRDLHCPDEGGGVAGNGHGAGHPPGEHEHGEPAQRIMTPLSGSRY